jgi:hypothetical protein
MCAPRLTRYDIQVLATRVNMGVSIFFTAAMIRAFRSARSRGNDPFRTLHEMHVAQWPQTYYSCDIPTHKTTPQERPFSHYIHFIHSHRLAAGMWTMMKNNFLWGKNLSSSFYLYRFRKCVSYGFPIISFCNPGVHYETPCTYSFCFMQKSIAIDHQMQ